MLALGRSHHVGLVLPEVESLSRVDLATHAHVEVLVGDLAITIAIEFVEDLLELVISQVETPLEEVEAKLFS